MSEPNGRRGSVILRTLLLGFLSLVASVGAVVSKLGPVGQDMREWALEQMERLK